VLRRAIRAKLPYKIFRYRSTQIPPSSLVPYFSLPPTGPLTIMRVLFGFAYIRTDIVAKALRFVFILADWVELESVLFWSIHGIHHYFHLSILDSRFQIGTFLDVHCPFFPDFGEGIGLHKDLLSLKCLSQMKTGRSLSKWLPAINHPAVLPASPVSVEALLWRRYWYDGGKRCIRIWFLWIFSTFYFLYVIAWQPEGQVPFAARVYTAIVRSR